MRLSVNQWLDDYNESASPPTPQVTDRSHTRLSVRALT